MPVTIKDVAKKAGVSISTVSRVINDSKPVSSTIKDRVLQVIEETGYVPNPVARSLVMKKSNLIGVLVPGVSEYYVGDFLNGIEEIARMYEYDIILCNTYNEAEREERYIDLLRSKQVAGIIVLCDIIRQNSVNLIKKYNIPGVYFGLNSDEYKDSYTANVDMKLLMEDMLRHLLDKSKNKKIVFLRSNVDNAREDYIEKIFNSSIKDLGYDSDKKIILKVKDNSDEVRKQIEKTVKKENISSILTLDDRYALNSIYCLEDMKIKIPDDIKVANLFETKLTRNVRPGITTMMRPLYDMGAVCARLIVKQIDGTKMSNKETILPYELIKRKSSNN